MDRDEPLRVAEAIQALDLRHAVITSVNRDELRDGGAFNLFRHDRPHQASDSELHDRGSHSGLCGDEAALALVAAAKPDILNHNIETVRRLFPSIRAQGKYQRSIDLLARARADGHDHEVGLDRRHGRDGG